MFASSSAYLPPGAEPYGNRTTPCPCSVATCATVGSMPPHGPAGKRHIGPATTLPMEWPCTAATRIDRSRFYKHITTIATPLHSVISNSRKNPHQKKIAGTKSNPLHARTSTHS